MVFDWDVNKAEANERKHRLSFSYVSRVFQDPGHVHFDASRPEDGEIRRKAVGVIGGKRYCVVYTMRDEVCWIISARRTNPKEDRLYADLRS
jgi:uncharacterized protein